MNHNDENYEYRLRFEELVGKERDRQDEKWGEQDHHPALWATILGEEFGEYCEAVNETAFDNGVHKEKGGYENMMRELVHVAAVAFAAGECLMRHAARAKGEVDGSD